MTCTGVSFGGASRLLAESGQPSQGTTILTFRRNAKGPGPLTSDSGFRDLPGPLGVKWFGAVAQLTSQTKQTDATAHGNEQRAIWHPMSVGVCFCDRVNNLWVFAFGRRRRPRNPQSAIREAHGKTTIVHGILRGIAATGAGVKLNQGAVCRGGWGL